MRKFIPVLVVVGVVFILFLWGTGVYNGLVKSEETVKSAWSQVENQYQRRYDLIPNLVAAVKGAAAFEKGVLEEVTKARASVGQIKVSPEMLSNPAQFAQFSQAQDTLGSALSRLMVVVEKYPELKSNQNFLALQTQLEGTENRVSVERHRYNEEVQKYNSRVRRFPTVLVAKMGGFGTKEYFKVSGEAAQAPKVQF